MTSALHTKRSEALRHAAVQAVLAPSVHNTQPWRFVISGNSLEIHADRSRMLRVLDPSGRQMLISLGCALFNARVALAWSGYEPTVQRFPDPTRPDLVARLTLDTEPVEWVALGALDPVIELRQTNRRRFSDDPVEHDVVDALVSVAAAEGATLLTITDPDHRMAAARLSQQADQFQNADPAYRAEIRAWTTDDPRRRDGVPALAVPHVDVGANDDLPIRDFDTRGMGWLPVETHSSMNQCLLLLCASEDNQAAWLRAGEALEHVLLEIARHGYAASPLTQVVEVTKTREALRRDLALQLYPDVLLRVGRAPSTPGSRRRRLVDMLSDNPDSGVPR